MNTERLNFVISIMLICLLFSVIYFIIYNKEKSYKYTIIDNNNNRYKTIEYEKNGDCIRFTEQSTNDVLEICGTYQIRENKKYTNQ